MVGYMNRVTISEKAEVITALYSEMEQLQNISNGLSGQSLEIHEEYINKMKSVSDKHKEILAKIVVLQETMEKLIGS